MNRLLTWISALLLFPTACCPSATAQAPVEKPTTIEIPFEFVHGSIVVQARVNGQGPFWMLLDSGADPSIVELETAKKAGLKLAANGHQGSGGGTGVNLAYETVLPEVQLGGLTATHVDALGMDLTKLSSALGRPIGGVLGYSLLKTRIVQIDYPNRKSAFLSGCALLRRTLEISSSKVYDSSVSLQRRHSGHRSHGERETSDHQR